MNNVLINNDSCRGYCVIFAENDVYPYVCHSRDTIHFKNSGGNYSIIQYNSNSLEKEPVMLINKNNFVKRL